jgi:L-amino acid N-acyltransferase YncA
MTKPEFKLKKDKFKSFRGGYSKLLDIYCRKCENIVAIYQKDGPGNLRRMYLDRIFYPENLTNLQNLNLKDIPELKCSKCGQILGSPYIYEKESRPAFRLFVDAIVKRPHKSKS